MRTILISDDERHNIAALARLARRRGYRVVADWDSNVVALAAAEHPDVILLDLSQRVDGRELLAQLKAEATTRDVPVWMISGHNDSALAKQCFDLGAEEYLAKPFDEEMVFAMVSRLA